MKKKVRWGMFLSAMVLFAGLWTGNAWAEETRTKIESVNLYLDGSRNDGWNEDITLQISTPDSEYHVGEWYLSGSPTAAVPTFKLELYAASNHYFDVASKNIQLSGLEARCTSRSTQDNRETLVLTVKIQGLAVDLDGIGSADLDDDGYGAWDEVPGSHHYEVRLYRGSSAYGEVKNTSENSFDFSSMITRKGDYYFKVRAIGSGTSDKGEWVESGTCYFDEPLSYSDDSQDIIGGPGNSSSLPPSGNFSFTWIQSGSDWFLKLPNGSFASNSWQYVDGNWYYLGSTGAMVTGWFYDGTHWYYLNPVSNGTKGAMMTGWIFVNSKYYYLNTVSDGTKGAMYANQVTPDGHLVGADGAMIY